MTRRKKRKKSTGSLSVGEFTKHGSQQGSEWKSTLTLLQSKKAQQIVNAARNGCSDATTLVLDCTIVIVWVEGHWTD
ncbi:hypothetical protein NC653_026676 [Populus alba x Populus x berolinensis]|uniref:Uncharacterized protein n=1 Tax=Populus alba x Populus x berolinensis TaxID=444605 RepID=A0AAD6ME82_9ROSI|nr:hypothetical protein NC653_026676 [Populus alba x Populus x berolinensis]